MSDIPKFVEFREEGPREGFQAEKRIYSTEEKVSRIGHGLDGPEGTPRCS